MKIKAKQLEEEKEMKKAVKMSSIIFLVMLLCNCAGSTNYMKLVPENEANYAPDNDHAMVVFMRPSTIGFAIQSSVFDITDGQSKLVGIVSAKKKVVCKTESGERLFMVVGESADFMKADLQAGKTYYSLVEPRMGVWKARFSLEPVHKADLNSEKFDGWVKSCQYYENTDASLKWAEQNVDSINSKKEKYLVKWNSRPEAERPALLSEDGM
jgi:hypothetical protein